MSEENKRTVRMTLDRKFGVSEKKDERRPRRDDDNREEKSFGDRGGFRSERGGFRGDRPRGARGLREDGSKREDGEGRFDRERRPRRFGDKPFGGRGRFGGDRRDGGRGGRFGRDGERPFSREDRTPLFRQRPEQKAELVDENIDEAALEARAAQVEATEESASNPPWFKKLLALTTEKGREREGRFLGEGVHVVDELVSKHREIVIAVYAVEGFEDEALVEKINEADITLHMLTAEQMKQLSSTVTTQGIIAHCRIANTKPNYEQSRSVLTLVDAVQDPGNLGTLFRTSLGFKSNGMVLGRGTVSPFNPKVVRGSSGTFLRVPFEFDIDLVDHINFLRSKGYTIIATDLHAKQSLKEIPQHKLRKMAFLVGNEGAGTNPYFIELADETVKIPMSSELESLNVSVAHGILSYEAAQIQEELK
ncbi:MAG: RNA methyltransferase [Fibrobacter sp.]|nr:RNA methyltransferase [Fibrobacter sp.]